MDFDPTKYGPEVARILALRGMDVLLMPHAARTKIWDDTRQSEAAARRQAEAPTRSSPTSRTSSSTRNR